MFLEAEKKKQVCVKLKPLNSICVTGVFNSHLIMSNLTVIWGGILVSSPWWINSLFPQTTIGEQGDTMINAKL